MKVYLDDYAYILYEDGKFSIGSKDHFPRPLPNKSWFSKERWDQIDKAMKELIVKV